MKIRRRGMFTAVLTLMLTLTMASATPYAAEAAANTTAFDTLAKAQTVTHRDGPFRLRGDETTAAIETVSGKTNKTTRYYHISGYDCDGSETFIQFESRMLDAKTGDLINGQGSTRTSFLVTPLSIYSKTTSPPTDWTEQDITAMLPKFISLGALDQFFMLELLNGERLPVYQEYMKPGKDAIIAKAECQTVQVDITRTQFSKLAGELTKDIKALLGPVADTLSDTSLALMQTFAKGMLSNLDAEVHFTVYIEKETGRIVKIDSTMDMANPYGSRMPGTVSRIQSEAAVTLYDFGKEVTRIVP